MNPQFCRTASDRNSARNEYIKNLQLETSNNLMNYNANQVFKQTGVLPPSITALLDTRSITEKYADTQKARVAVLSGLREITDGANANQIVSQIQSKDMITLLNNLPQIIAEIKPKWSLGITAPAFMGYWDKYKMAIAMNSGVSIYPIIQSTQTLTNIEGLLQDIQTTIATKEQYDALGRIFDELTPTTQLLMAKKMNSRIRELSQSLIEEAKKAEEIKDPIVKQNRIALLGELASQFPTQSETQTLINEAQIAQQLDNTPTMSKELGTNTLSLQQPAVDMVEGYFPVATTPQEAIEQFVKMGTPSSSATTKETYEQTGLNPPRQRQQSSQESESSPAMSDITTESYVNVPKQNLPSFFTNIKNYDQFFRLNWSGKQFIIKVLIDQGEINKKDIDYSGEADNFSGLRKTNWDETNLPELVKAYYNKKPAGGAQESKSSGTEPPLEPTPAQIAQGGKENGTGIKRKHRIHGRGVNSHRTHAPTTNLTSGGNYYQKPKIDTSHKVEKVPSYIEFGKHVLHQHNLQGGILQIRRRSGTIINDLPRQAVGGKLKKVLITLTGTGSPSFEDINELSDSEKNLLNKIVKTCKIDQRLLVPTPNKSKEEQDFNRLQILSGEITAGNNNPQIVKELKTILLRLKNVGRIPKKHAHEIMEDLLSLGY
jgi:hypothetical protein